MADSIIIKGKEIKVSDKITVYTGKGSGSNYQGTVTQVDPSDNTIFVDVRRYNSNQPHRSTGWYTPKVSGRGIPYVAEE